MKTFKILDLFCGAGGFSYGLEMIENYKTVLACDIDKNALKTFSENFPSSSVILGDMTDLQIKNKIIQRAKELEVNMIVGGPPCQGFSNKGKKLGLKDPRNYLFLEYLKIVESLKPEIFIIENVKTLLTASNGYFINEIKSKINNLGYVINYKVLNSYDYGVPQNRERTIIVAHKSKVLSLPENKNVHVTVRDAISDLSYLNSGEGSYESDYLSPALTNYQKYMRKGSEKLYNHMATNHSKIALNKLKLIPPEKGKEYLPNELLGKQKFKTTWCRLKWNYPSPTIDTRFDTPSNGTNSHPKLNRAITPREAARIQSFPDRFHFLGNKTSICKQIGNAVPPLLAKEIGQSILNQLNKIDNFSDSEITIYNRDAYELVTELKSKNFHFDHLITDPPYNISQKNNFSTMKSAKRNGIDFGEWDKNFDLFSWIKPYIELLNKNGSVIIFCSFRYLSYIVSILEENDMKVKDVMIWTKSNPMPRNTTRRYVQDTEYAIWAVKNKSKWVFNKPNGIPYLRAKFVTSIVSGKEKSIHPTQKSLKLMKEIINIHTNENDLIIDPFMGSGTTGVAAKELKRKFLGIEKEKKYFDIAKERLNFNKITKDNN